MTANFLSFAVKIGIALFFAPFLIRTIGPSIKEQNLRLLKDEITFS